MAYVSYPKCEKDRVSKIFEILNEENYLHFPENECKIDDMEYADFVIFFMNNEFLDSPRFRKELEYANFLKKIIIPVTIGNVKNQNFIDLNEFKVIKLVEPICSSANATYLKCLNKLINHAAIMIEPLDLLPYLDLIQIETNGLCENLLKKIRFISNEELLEEINGNLNILNIENVEIVAKLNMKPGGIFKYCWIDHLEQVFVLQCCSNNKSCAFLYDKTGNVCLSKNLNFDLRHLVSINYDNRSRQTTICIYDIINCYFKIFMFNHNFGEITEKKIRADEVHVSGRLIYAWYCGNADKLSIFDINYNFITSFNLPIPIQKVITDNTNRSSYVFFKMEKLFVVFNPNNFQFIGCFKNQLNLQYLINNTLVFCDNYKKYFIYKIDFFKKPIKKLDPKLCCKLNPLDTHLLKNPYLLPCGNSACFECINDNFNVHTDTILCNFETCLQEHRLVGLKYDLSFEEALKNNLKEIGNALIESGTPLLNDTGKKF